MTHSLSRLEQDSQLNIRRNKEHNRREPEPDFFNLYKKGNDEHENDDSDEDPEDTHRFMARNKNAKMGEITGKVMHIDDIEFGMPIRSKHIGKRISKKDDTMLVNRCDFDLYDENHSDNKSYEIDTYEPGSSHVNFSGFNDIHHGTEKVIPEVYGSDPGSFMSANLNKFCLQLHNLIQTQVGVSNKFCVSAYSLYSIFGALYNVSHGRSESELYDYFGMIAKENVYEGISYIENIRTKLSGQLIIKNMIFIDNIHDIDQEMMKHISKIASIHQISLDHITTEFKTINDYIKKLTANTVLPISRKVLESTDLLCVTIGYVKPIWKMPFDKIIDAKFLHLDGNQKITKMLLKYDGTYDYYEDSENQVIELKCVDDKMSMGIILPKDFTEPIIKHSELIVCIKELKPTAIDELCIPCFTDQVKIRLSNILYQSGLKGVFNDLAIPELVKDGSVKVTDIVQNITVHVSATNMLDKDKKPPKRMRSGISNIRFLATKPFIYYFRIIPTNTIVMMGYCSV